MDYSKLVVLIKDEFETLDVISETLGLLSLFIRMQKKLYQLMAQC